MLRDSGQVDDMNLVDDYERLLADDRISALEAEVAQLREALARRTQYGVVTGLLAARYGISPERAWQFVVRLSQQTNLKVQVIARVIHDRSFDRLAPEDEALAAQLDAYLRGTLGRCTSAPVNGKMHGEPR